MNKVQTLLLCNADKTKTGVRNASHYFSAARPMKPFAIPQRLNEIENKSRRGVHALISLLLG
jgi:hypothetical protein